MDEKDDLLVIKVLISVKRTKGEPTGLMEAGNKPWKKAKDQENILEGITMADGGVFERSNKIVINYIMHQGDRQK